MSLRFTLGVVGLVASFGLGGSVVGCGDDTTDASGGGSNGGSSAGGASSGGASFSGECVPTDDSCYLSGQSGPGVGRSASPEDVLLEEQAASRRTVTAITPDLRTGAVCLMPAAW